MRSFVVNSIDVVDDSPFDRQERISWWSQEKLSEAKVMVVGAGAIGNETLKNLALLGVGNIFIVDFDNVEKSNLSRTVLFRKSDVNKKKAEIAAARTKELSLFDKTRVDYFHGDVVWELGTGVFRNVDIVLGCLDNVESRFAINRQCWLAGTPWIDAGIYELDGHVSLFSPPDTPCYQCHVSPERINEARHRYSCDNFKRSMLKEGKMPTVQISSAIVSAIQVQETVKYLCGQDVPFGKTIHYFGKINDFDVNNLTNDSNCLAHVSYPEVISLPLDTVITLRTFLEYVSQPSLSGRGAYLDFRADRTFVTTVLCRKCRKSIDLYKPSFRIFDFETICNDCKDNRDQFNLQHQEIQTLKITIGQFDLFNTPQRILNMTLRELGVPYLHIVAVADKENNYKYYELDGDKKAIFKRI
ncbi:MAG: ThiF family adenylyltransferase [Nitrospirae bacterium]|nr:ThiF family adenylyltransferase [Nitrospirota bacterium]